MDPTDDPTLDPAIAAAMGFTSFGQQRAPKRLKYTPDSSLGGTATRIQKPMSATGANGVQLGVRRKGDGSGAASANRNADEIDLEDDGDAGQSVRSGDGDVSVGSAGTGDAGVKGVKGDTGAKGADVVGGKEQRKGKERKSQPTGGLAGFLTRGQNLKTPSVPGADGLATAASAVVPDAAESSVNDPSLMSLPQRLPVQLGKWKDQGHGQQEEQREIPHRLEDLTRDDLFALRKGVRNEDGDVAYFLPSFLEDPWRV